VSKLHSAELSGLNREAGTGDIVKKLREEPDGEGLVAIGPNLVKRYPLSAGRSLQTPAAIFDHHLKVRGRAGALWGCPCRKSNPPRYRYNALI
jgi:hypothetical protein